jgi:hypothetical protein
MKSKVTEKKLTELRWNYLMHSKPADVCSLGH